MRILDTWPESGAHLMTMDYAEPPRRVGPVDAAARTAAGMERLRAALAEGSFRVDAHAIARRIVDGD